jgi:hypothetical protein
MRCERIIHLSGADALRFRVLCRAAACSDLSWAGLMPARHSLVARVLPIRAGHVGHTGAPHPCIGRYGLFASMQRRTGDFISTYGGHMKPMSRPGAPDTPPKHTHMHVSWL